jgi:hypothetical protein
MATLKWIRRAFFLFIIYIKKKKLVGSAFYSVIFLFWKKPFILLLKWDKIKSYALKLHEVFLFVFLFFFGWGIIA